MFLVRIICVTFLIALVGCDQNNKLPSEVSKQSASLVVSEDSVVEKGIQSRKLVEKLQRKRNPIDIQLEDKYLIESRKSWIIDPVEEILYGKRELSYVLSKYNGRVNVKLNSTIKLFKDKELKEEAIAISPQKSVIKLGEKVCEKREKPSETYGYIRYSSKKDYLLDKTIIRDIQENVDHPVWFVMCSSLPFIQEINNNSGTKSYILFTKKIGDLYISEDIRGVKLYFKIEKEHIVSEYDERESRNKKRACFNKLFQQTGFLDAEKRILKNISEKNIDKRMFPDRLKKMKNIEKLKEEILMRYLYDYYFTFDKNVLQAPESLCLGMDMEDEISGVKKIYFDNIRSLLYLITGRVKKDKCKESEGVYNVSLNSPLVNGSISYIYNQNKDKLVLNGLGGKEDRNFFNNRFSNKNYHWFKGRNGACKKYLKPIKL